MMQRVQIDEKLGWHLDRFVGISVMDIEKVLSLGHCSKALVHF